MNPSFFKCPTQGSSDICDQIEDPTETFGKTNLGAGSPQGDAFEVPDSFVIMARTDALAVEGLNAALDRAAACVEAGADMIFPEAITELSMYKTFADRVKVPILANITEFGATPLYTTEELAYQKAQAGERHPRRARRVQL